MHKILLVEDDEILGMSLTEYLNKEGFPVTLAKSLSEANTHNRENFDLVILDWMLPDGNGIDYLKKIRETKTIPVIMLTARGELIDKVLGLESGANDYMTKPFEPRELLARIRTQLRNISGVEEAPKKIVRGQLSIDWELREVTWQGKGVYLTKMEFELLLLLAEHPGRAYSREELLNKVWGFENYPTTRTVDTHVLQLRQKISDNVVETLRGVGISFH